MYKLILVSGTVAILLVYVALCLWIQRRFSIWSVLPFSFLLAASYSVNMLTIPGGYGSAVYGSLYSDSSFIVGYVNNFVQGRYSDFYDASVPPHYPPLWFFLVGSVARGLGLTALQASFVVPALSLAVLPWLVFALGLHVWEDKAVAFFVTFAFVVLGAGGASYLFDDPRPTFIFWAIHKPYELFGALLSVGVSVSFLRLSSCSTPYSYRRLVALGAAFGILVTLYYPWAVVTAATMLSVALVSSHRYAMVTALVAVGLIGMVGSSFYWFPYVSMLFRTAHDANLGWYWTSRESFDLSRVTLGLGYCGSLFLLGTGSLIAFRKNRGNFALFGFLLIALYGWYASSWVLFPLFRTSLLSEKSSILIFVVLALLSGVALERFASKTALPSWLKTPRAWGLVGILLLPHPLLWNKFTDRYLMLADRKVPDGLFRLAAAIEEVGELPVVLAASRAGAVLPAIARVSLYLSPNIHFANPLSRYEYRRGLVEKLRNLSGAELTHRLHEMGVDVLVLEKDQEGYWAIPVQATPEAKSLTSILVGDPAPPTEWIEINVGERPVPSLEVLYEDADLLAFSVKRLP